ncbi:MAG: hypothetical protein GTO03_17940 [Planctomycetales bacterium]|nr:hypothetical protein [Planctomycetales bacterium]
MKDSVKEKVPVEFEIDRARKMVQNLLPDIRKAMHVIATEEVEVERLQRQIAQAEENLAQEKTDIVRLRDDLTSPRDGYTYAGRYYTVSQVRRDLANRFERYKTDDATLASLREIYDARTRSLEAARQKLEHMLAAKRQLEVDVENLEARLKMVEVAQTSSEINVDDSRLGRCKELITKLRTRLDVAERIVNAEGQYRGEIILEEPAAADLEQQITEYFDQPLDGEELVAGRTR